MPINPSSKVYTLKNFGGSIINWVAVVSESWIDLSAEAGTLSPGETIDITVSFNEEADELEPREAPYTANLNFTNVTNDCGSVQLQIVYTNSFTILFERFDGPFSYPILYRTITMSGDNAWRFAAYGSTPWAVDCCAPCPSLNGLGVVIHNFSGSSTYDINTNTYTGALVDEISGRGGFPAPGYLRPAPELQTISDPNYTDFFRKIVDASPAFGGEFLDEFTTFGANGGSFTRKWYSSVEGPPPNIYGERGYFVSGWGGMMYCPGYSASAVFTDPVTLGEIGFTVPDLTGDPAKTQHITSCSEDGLEYTGSISRVTMTFNPVAGKSRVFIDYFYTVTPDDGSPEYKITVGGVYSITPNQQVTISEEFPKICGAVVVSTDIKIYYLETRQDDFESLRSRDQIQVPANSSWANSMRFYMTTPNSEAWDNFEEETEGFITTLSNGLGWAGFMQFTNFDPIIAYDEFEEYPEGEINVIYGGVGWKSYMWISQIDAPTAFDDFSALASDPDFPNIEYLGVLGDQTPPANVWSQIGLNGFTPYSGYFTTIDNPTAYDDFSSLSSDPAFPNITYLGVPGGDNSWSQVGLNGLTPYSLMFTTI